MAFASIAAANGGVSGGDVTNHTINLPAGIVSGDLLEVEFSCDGNPVITWPSGWTEVVNNGTGGPTPHQLHVRKRVADGTEGSTITITTDAAQASSHVSRRITGHNVGVMEATSAIAASQDVNPDPPSLTPSWGAKDTLWITGMGHRLGGRTTNAFPTNYTLDQQDQNGGSSGNPDLASAGRELNAASEDPGTFTLSGGALWTAFTLAIEPAGAGGAQVVTPLPTAASFVLATPAVVVGTAVVAPSAINAFFSIASPALIASTLLTPGAAEAFFSVQGPTMNLGPATVVPSPIEGLWIVQTPSLILEGEITVTGRLITIHSIHRIISLT